MQADWQTIMAAIGAVVLGGGGIGVASRNGWFSWLSGKGRSATGGDPDKRETFNEYRHWMTEFARNTLEDQATVDLLNQVNDRFNLIRDDKPAPAKAESDA